MQLFISPVSTICSCSKCLSFIHHIHRRVRGLKGKAAWTYSRSTSASSVSSLDVNPPSSNHSNSSSPQNSRSPSPIQILNNTSSVRNKSMSPTSERDSLIVVPDPDAGGSRSAPQTPVMADHVPLAPTTSNSESSLDFAQPHQRR